MKQEAPKAAFPGTVERRAFPRWPVRLGVQYGSGDDLALGETSDISECGLGFSGERPYAVGTEIEVKFLFDLPGSTWFHSKALVRRCEGGRLGVEFVGMAPSVRTRLREALRAQAARRR